MVVQHNTLTGADLHDPKTHNQAVADGGTGETTAQSAINTLSQVSGATNEHVLTKDTVTGNAEWKTAGSYSHPSSRQCTSGLWAWASISGKPSTFAPSAHNQSASTITSGILALARIPTTLTGKDADKVDGCHAGTSPSNVLKLATGFDGGEIYYGHTGNYLGILGGGTNGYQLTTHGMSVNPTWAISSDLIFSDTHCPKCGLEFQEGDVLVLYLIGKNEVGDILTIPMHKDCAEAPKKTVTIKRKVMEDQYILDELTGEPKVQRVQKMQEKTVTKHKMKEGYVLDNKSGKALKIGKDGKRGKTEYNLSDALETVEETVSEVVYEDVEYTL